MQHIYGEIFDKKRLAPRAITDVDQDRGLHNCTTLGENSGSVIVDLKSGESVGLHFSDNFLHSISIERLRAARKVSSSTAAMRSPTRRCAAAPPCRMLLRLIGSCLSGHQSEHGERS